MPRADLPDLAVRVNGLPLSTAAMADLRSVTVQEDLAVLSMFTLELHNWDDALMQVSWSDSSQFAIGNEVEISLGYAGDLHKVMLAEITSLEPAFTAGQPPLLTVRGYDHRHRLARGRKTRTFLHMKESQIAEQIAREAGLRSQIDPTALTLDYVFQSNQSDWDFLRHRASLIGYEIFVRDKVLYFRSPQIMDPPADKLSLGEDITDFSPRLSSLSQSSTVTVRFWDVKQKKAVAATVRSGSGLGGPEPGYSVARKAFGASTMAIVRESARTLPEADPIAQGQFSTGSLAYIEGEVVAYGQPQLHAGTVVEIAGAGQKFSGRYYVTSVTHTMTGDHGYQTSLTVQRNASA